MEFKEVKDNYPVWFEASTDALSLFGPKFTNTPKGHIETDIAAAASLAGLIILRRKVNLDKYAPGQVLLSDIHTEQDEISKFMTAAAMNFGLEHLTGWDKRFPECNKPLYSVQDMTQKIEEEFYLICEKHKIKKEHYPYVATLTAIRLVAAGNAMKILDQEIGKNLAAYHLIAGLRTAPYPFKKNNQETKSSNLMSRLKGSLFKK